MAVAVAVVEAVHRGPVQRSAGNGVPAARDSYPGKDEVADFLQAYVERFELPVRLDTTVTRLSRADDGGYLAETTTGPIRGRPGRRRYRAVPSPIHAGDRQRARPGADAAPQRPLQGPDDLPDGRILVAGGANSGQQIALELSDSRQVDIAVGQKLPTLPQRPLGRDIWWWLTATRLARVPVSSRLGQRLSQRDVVIGGGLRELGRHGVGVRPRVTGASGRTINFEDGESAEYDAVVWATGFRIDHSWIEMPEVKDERGQIQHVRGVTDSPGLYLLGMTWQHTRTSALLGWVGNDAAYLADRIEETRQAPARQREAGRDNFVI